MELCQWSLLDKIWLDFFDHLPLWGCQNLYSPSSVINSSRIISHFWGFTSLSFLFLFLSQFFITLVAVRFKELFVLLCEYFSAGVIYIMCMLLWIFLEHSEKNRSLLWFVSNILPVVCDFLVHFASVYIFFIMWKIDGPILVLVILSLSNIYLPYIW